MEQRDKINQWSEEFLKEIAEEERANPVAKPVDKINLLGQACKDAADLELDIQDLTDSLQQKKEQLRRLLSERIPALMEQAGTKKFVLDGRGNLPDKEISLKSFCYANIAASWPAERRNAAFDAVRAHDGADLIKHTVTFKFPRGSEQYMKELLSIANQLRLDCDVKEEVHSQTLSKWLRERRKKGLSHPPLDVIGATVGQEAVIKDV